MNDPFEFTFPRYLAAKKSVDDRAMSRPVWERLAAEIATLVPQDRPLHILEVGAGIGSMLERCIEWGLFDTRAGPVNYTAVDEQTGNILWARRCLRQWAKERDVQFEPGSPDEDTSLRCRLTVSPSVSVQVELRAEDMFVHAAERSHPVDLLVAHAVLDLLDLPTALPKLLSVVRPGGLCYFTINFDGVTGFLPVIEPNLDQQIERLYHRSMDERRRHGQPAGHSQTGRRLFHALPAAGVEILAAGASDWVVHSVGGGYSKDEAYFLRCILHFVADTLSGHSELVQKDFQRWLGVRQAQILQGELVYFAHQFDFLGRFLGGNSG